jgi:hypothetical protein
MSATSDNNFLMRDYLDALLPFRKDDCSESE